MDSDPDTAAKTPNKFEVHRIETCPDEMMKDEPAGYGQDSQEPANKKSRKH
mgnify:CR=1 FL=1